MPLFKLTDDRIEPVRETTLAAAGWRERQDLWALPRRHAEVLSPDLMVVAEEFGSWDESHRRIDLLAVDRDANLVVIELERDASHHMELQAVRYAAMVSALTFDQLVDTYADFLARERSDKHAREELESFLARPEDGEPALGDVRIVLVAGQFSKELTTAVLWLNDKGLDITCVRLKVYQEGTLLLADVEQIIPLKEAQEYLIQIGHKRKAQQASARGGTLEAFWRELPAKLHPVARELLGWFESQGAYLWPGSGSIVPIVRAGGGSYQIIRMRTDGQVAIYFDWMSRKPPFSDRDLRLQLRDRLQSVPGIEIPLDKLEKRPRFELAVFAKPEAMARFREAVGFWMERVREAVRDGADA